MVGCSYEDVDKIYIIFILENTGKCTLLLIMYGGMTSIFWSSMSFLHSIVIKSPARGDFTMAEEKKIKFFAKHFLLHKGVCITKHADLLTTL